MNSELLERLLRTALQIGGTFVAGASWYTDSRWGLITGAVVTLVTTGWTIWAGWNAPKNA